MKQTLAEFLQNKSNKALKKFCFEAEPLATKLEADLATAKEAFGEVVQYFGENPKLTQPNSVFPVLQRFVAGFQVRKNQPLLLCPEFSPQKSQLLRVCVCGGGGGEGGGSKGQIKN